VPEKSRGRVSARPYVLIVHAGRAGQTHKIGARMADRLRRHGYRTRLIPVAGLDGRSVTGAGAVVVGAAVHRGRYAPELVRRLRRLRDRLDKVPTALYSVSLGAASTDPAERERASARLHGLVRDVGLSPFRTAAFAGALRYTRYGPLTRWMMRSLMRRQGSRDLDAHRDYEYTDWRAVDEFTDRVESALGPPGAPSRH
jgi:menaquinone-dependent protoporphyrinogen oxidase